MKNTILSLSFFVGLSAFAQRDPQYQLDYEMQLTKPGSSIAISVYKSPSEQEKTLVLATSTSNCVPSKGVRIRLTNGDILNYRDISVECSPAVPGRPNAKVSIPLTAALESKLDGQEIAEFSFSGIITTVKFKESNENLVLLRRWVKDEQGF